MVYGQEGWGEWRLPCNLELEQHITSFSVVSSKDSQTPTPLSQEGFLGSGDPGRLLNCCHLMCPLVAQAQWPDSSQWVGGSNISEPRALLLLCTQLHSPLLRRASFMSLRQLKCSSAVMPGAQPKILLPNTTHCWSHCSEPQQAPNLSHM